LTVGIIAAVIGIAFLAAACQSLTAFGFALVTVPLLSLAWEPKPAVVTSTFLGTLILLPLLYEVRARVDVPRVAPILLGSFAGIAPGVLLLDRIGQTPLQVLVAFVVILAALSLYFAPRLSLRSPLFSLSLGVGALSGALRAATSAGGPPVVLYALSFERDVERFRATLLAVFLPTSIVTVAGLALAGLITNDILIASGVGLPAAVAGNVAGRWLRSRVSEAVFRNVVLAILVVSSVAVLATALA
jgi:uncharacterized membrane protein YfcA